MRHLARRLVVLPALVAGVLSAARELVRGSPPSGEDRAAPDRPRPRRRAARLAGVALLVAAGGFLVAASGLAPIAASEGHWAVTRWFLDFAMRRAVATHAIASPEPPPLDDPALVLRGAGHYEGGCRPCHGSPGLRQPRVPRAMTPPPPHLPEVVSEWDAGELFYIVKHGVKFTGMPAWPAQQRDDEVWAVVAFLRALPGLDAEAYRRLVRPEAPPPGGAPVGALRGADAAPHLVLQVCARCHGADGAGRGGGAFPRLGGQRADYLLGALRAYARGERRSGIMEPIAAGLSDAEMGALADHYAAAVAATSASPAAEPSSELAASIARGREIARRGIPAQRVPACVACHGPGDAPRNPAYPLLAGQEPRYLLLQLELLARDHRGGSPYATIMQPTAARLTAAQMRDVARYYGSLGAALR